MNCSDINPEEILSVFAPAVIIMIAICILVVSLAVIIIKAVIFCRIFSKAGYHWALGLLMLVPIACIVMPFVLAFGKWPIYKELEHFRQQQNKTAC